MRVPWNSQILEMFCVLRRDGISEKTFRNPQDILHHFDFNINPRRHIKRSERLND
jgi:hypothetical protein